MSNFEDPEVVRPDQGISLEDQLADDIEDFVEEVVQRMTQLGVTANDAWMFFRTYQSVGDYSMLPEVSEVELTVIKKVVDMGVHSDIRTATTVRIVRVEKINVEGGIEYLIQDASIDELGEIHYLPDLVFLGHASADNDAGEHSVKGVNKQDDPGEAHPYIPLIWISDGQIKASYHKISEEISHPTIVSFGDGGTVMPFGNFESLTDELYNFGQIKDFFAQLKDLEPDHKGVLSEDI